MPLVSIELGFSRAPAVTDDKSKGYMESWLWEDQSSNKLYKCIGDTVGAAQWVLHNSSLSSPTVTTGVSAPTTATSGNLGDVRFDTVGNRWELIKIIGSDYYWALPVDVYPALGTEYVSHYDSKLGKIVYKQEKDFGAMPNGATVSVAHNLSPDFIYDFTYSWKNRTTFSGLFNGNSAASTSTIRGLVDLTNMTIASSYNTSANSAYFRIRYTKA